MVTPETAEKSRTKRFAVSYCSFCGGGERPVDPIPRLYESPECI
jgi:hypothetical protein